MGEMRDGREFGTNELPTKDQEIDRLRAENERLTAELAGASERGLKMFDAKNYWRDRALDAEGRISNAEGHELDATARALAAEARVEKAVEDMRERAAKVEEQFPMRFAGQTPARIAHAIRSLASFPKESAESGGQS